MLKYKDAVQQAQNEVKVKSVQLCKGQLFRGFENKVQKIIVILLLFSSISTKVIPQEKPHGFSWGIFDFLGSIYHASGTPSGYTTCSYH